MLLVMGNTRNLSNALKAQLALILPKDWSATFSPDSRREVDSWLDIVPPRGPGSRFAIELKARFEPRDIDNVIRSSERLPKSERTLLMASRLSSRSRQMLRERGISHADLAGNIWLSTDSLLIDKTSVDKLPTAPSEQRPRTSLRGPITGRVVRFLCDVRPPYKVREIAAQTSVNPGNVSRIVAFLEQERLVGRGGSGAVTEVDWEALIQRWSEDLKKERHAETLLEPRGVDVVTGHLSNCTMAYAITGSFASARLAPTIVPIAIDLYVENIDEAREVLSLRASERIGNVRLIEAFDRVAFERTIGRNELVLACPSQIAADLLSLPKRSQDEYSALLDWMKRHESDWRR
jgi:hypothetical protein